jgi:hypothetical protein
MHRTSSLLALTSAAIAAAQGYSTQCSDVTLNGAWLVATCPTGNGDEIASSVYLPSKIGNNNGNMEVGCCPCHTMRNTDGYSGPLGKSSWRGA